LKMNSKNPGFRRQFPANMATNVASFLVNLVVGLFIVPYYIRHLGVAAYGLIPLATSLTAYLSLITLALNGAVSRYLVIDIHKNDMASANRVFNTAFFSITALAAILVPVAALLSWYAPHIFSIPADVESGARWLFFFSMLSFLIGIISGNFSVSAFALNRLDIQNLINIASVAARTLPVILFFALFGAGLQWVGWAFMLGAFAALALSVLSWRKLTPFLVLRIKDFDRNKLGEITNMGWWLTINQVGALLFLNTDIIIVNLLFGAEITGKYGAIMQWPMLLRTMAGVFAGVFSPMVLILFARGDRKQMLLLSEKSLKFLSLGMALPIGLICGFGGPVLTLWLGPGFSTYSMLLAIMCAHLSVNLAVLPLFSIQTAANKVRVPGWITLGSGVLMLVLALVLGKFTPLGVYGVALAGAIMLTLKNVVFTPIYAAAILGMEKTAFLKPLAGGVAGTIGVWSACAIINRIITPDSWAALIILSVLISVFYCAAVYLKATSREEKELVASVLRRN
jgi:O-antigen/teichoic acid export membrane protein